MEMKKERAAALTALIVSGLCVYSALAQDTNATSQCGVIGNANAEDEVTVIADRYFYIDVNNPAPCNGSVTSWRVCYYGPRARIFSRRAMFYWATYAVYRPEEDSDGELHYRRLSEIYRAVRHANGIDPDPLVDGEVEIDDFACYDDKIDVGESPFIVQEGDVIGACVFDGEDEFRFDRRQLNVVGETSTAGESLLWMEAGDADCSREELPSDVDQEDLDIIPSRRLHIKANIVSETMHPTTTLTSATTEYVAPMTTATIQTTTRLSTDHMMHTTMVTSQVTTTPAPTPALTATVSEEITRTTVFTSTFIEPVMPSSPPGGLSVSSAINMAIGILVVLAVAVTMFATAIYLGLFYTRRKAKRLRSTSENFLVLDNVTYGEQADFVSHIPEESTNMCTTYEEPQSSTVISEDQRSYSYVNHGAFGGPVYATSHSYEYLSMRTNEGIVGEVCRTPLSEMTIPYTQLLRRNREEDIYENVRKYDPPAGEENELYAQIRASGIQNIPSECIQIKGDLGSGQFGTVQRGLWKTRGSSIEVALKLLKEGSSEMCRVKFLQEAATMAQFRHPNVVTLHGVVSKTEPLMLVVELVRKGDLKNHLVTLRPDPGELPASDLPEVLLSFSQQVALGMQYLSAKGFVHRDLAARNILVSSKNKCKIADFGLSRDLEDDAYYVSQGGMIPVKWTAPEAINYKKYSTATDVWSYGCLLYEIWSLGHKPFEGLTNAEATKLVNSGKRLCPPPGCPRVIYELMIKAWNPTASSRPNFREIVLSLVESGDKGLTIPRKALDAHHLAGILGSPLKAGEKMYTDLRDTYLTQDKYHDRR